MTTKQIGAWGTRFDSLSSSPPPQTSPRPRGDVHDISLDGELRKEHPKDGRTPHNASIFVGSLPSTMDQTELSNRLAHHLQDHAQIKNIKVVRDSKGGVCAFVQCEDADAAASLIKTLHTAEPKPFEGRILRFERARAFRTLLISYRTPTSFGSRADGSADYSQSTYELGLPFAMRIWTEGNSKFPTILYNAAAEEAEANEASVPDRNNEEVVGKALYLQPVTFDAEALRLVCLHFGQLEKFGTVQPEQGIDPENDQNLYPSPHNGRKSDIMDNRCFEVKWAHRDDCVNALMSLRRVPYLAVTWAHQPQGMNDRNRSRNNSAYSSYALEREHGQRRARTTTGNLSVGSRGGSIRDTSATLVESPIGARWKSASPELDFSSPFTGSWGDAEFPPLVSTMPENEVAWADGRNGLTGGSPRSSKMDMAAVARPGPGTKNPLAIYRQAFASDEDNSSNDVGQELDMPPTPGLSMSPITPKTPSMLFPPTPTTASQYTPPMAGFHGHLQAKNVDVFSPSPNYGHGRTIDPTTLFVGGLEMYGQSAWDEEKVEHFFQRFGGLESVSVVRPATGKAAFAFVKFNNTEAPARAVAEVHNQMYEGRVMRVQLRDCNPPKGNNWKNAPRTRMKSIVVGAGTDPRSFNQAEFNQAAYNSPARNLVHPISLGSPSHEPTIQLENQQYKHVEDRASSTGGNASQPASEAPSNESYREWYDNVPNSATMTPPPASASVPIPGAAAAVPFSMLTGGFFPQPWMAPFGSAVQYPFAFYGGYPGQMPPGYAMPQHQSGPGYSSNNGSDASGPTSSVPPPNAWPGVQGMYGAYMPYPPFFGPGQPGDPGSVVPTTTPHMPPVVPSSFIANESGAPAYVADVNQHRLSSDAPSGPQHAPTLALTPHNAALATPHLQRMNSSHGTPQMLPSWVTPTGQGHVYGFHPPDAMVGRPGRPNVEVGPLAPSLKRHGNRRELNGPKHLQNRPPANREQRKVFPTRQMPVHQHGAMNIPIRAYGVP
ncbi:hypothetical protein CYLTODRAFT_495322 [Cylindrobasidium torrendii FP15055 ss-10]|uniref:RRM domain-containing protein n=1 Tax=Cylindrobasidium torrendii FP15055 ss-10 TaxID=1314674 RepID=A0A0D7ATI2_9AGAR|nr:hypothetical protein CYLTODRAFT_495322 [Cylindrobasidium torrendii FP15055 ss-10]